MEVASPGVVAEPFPAFEDLDFGGLGELFEIWIGFQPGFEVGQSGFHLGLLEHEL